MTNQKYSCSVSPLKRLLSCALGASAVELALVLPLFLGLVSGIVEAGWLMTKLSMVDRAVSNATRFVYTGAASNDDSVTRETIEAFICEEAAIIASCAENIALDLIVINNFSSIPTSDAECRERDLDFEPTVTYDPGNSSEIVYMRVCVTTEIFMPLLGLGFALNKTDLGNYQFTSGLAFANEPF